MHTIYRYMGYAVVTSSFALLALVICLHSALKSDGIVIGNPATRIVYLNAPKDTRLEQLAAALPMNQFRGK